jgi:xanthine dehydrogenase accessory factor
MVTTRRGGIAGSVSAGCVEGAVIEEGQRVIKTKQPRLMTFGVADEEAWGVGLACGGTIQVFVEPGEALEEVYGEAKIYLQEGKPFAIVSVLKGSQEQLNKKLLLTKNGGPVGNLELGEYAAPVRAQAIELIDREESRVVDLDENLTVFVEIYPPPPRLIVVGAVHLADALVSMAGLAGFETIVIDPRKAFATRQRFPHAGELIACWPQEVLPEMALDRSTYVVILTHDPKVDDPALQIALASECRYVGALGSRRTNQKRLGRLRKAGLTEEQIRRLHAPIGLDIGGRTPAELAVSILAEMIQARNRVEGEA